MVACHSSHGPQGILPLDKKWAVLQRETALVTLLSAHFPHTREGASFRLSMCGVEGVPFRWLLTDGTEAAKSLVEPKAPSKTSPVNAEHPAGRPREMVA